MTGLHPREKRGRSVAAEATPKQALNHIPDFIANVGAEQVTTQREAEVRFDHVRNCYV